VWFLFLQEKKIPNTCHSSFLFNTLFKLQQIKENSSKEQKKPTYPLKGKIERRYWQV
jgi:hypothetical protein